MWFLHCKKTTLLLKKLNKYVSKLHARNYRGRHSTPKPPTSFILPPSLTHTHTYTHARILTLYLSTPLHAATTHAGIQRAQETDRVEGNHCFPQLHSSLESLHHLPPHQHPIIITTVSSSQLDHETALFWLLRRGNRAPRSGRGGTY